MLGKYFFFTLWCLVILEVAANSLSCASPLQVFFDGVQKVQSSKKSEEEQYLADVLTPFSVKIVIKSEKSGAGLKIERLDNFHVLRRSDSKSTTSFNGVIEHSHTINLQLKPKKEGENWLGPFKWNDGNQFFSKPAIKFIVKETPPAQNGEKGKTCFATISLNAGSQIFVWQPVKLISKIFYMPEVIQEIATGELEIPDFDVVKIGNPELSKEVINSCNYGVQTTTYMVTPKKAGLHEIPPVEIKYLAKESKSSQENSQDPADLFFANFLSRINLIEGYVRSNRLNVSVVELPVTNLDITAIGSFSSLHACVDGGKKTCERNEPIILKLTLEGEGNFDAITHPVLNFPPYIKYYNSKSEFFPNHQAKGFSGKKVFEYILQIDHVGEVSISEQLFEFFCPEQAQVCGVKSLPLVISVIGIPGALQESSSLNQDQKIVSNAAASQNIGSGQLSVSVEDKLGLSHPLQGVSGKNSYTTSFFSPASQISWMLYFILLLLITAVFLVHNLKVYFWSRYKKRYALYECFHRLKKIQQHKNFDQLYDVILFYLAIKFGKDPRTLDLDEELFVLAHNLNIPESLLKELSDLLQQTQEISFGRKAYSLTDFSKIIGRIKNVLEELDQALKKKQFSCLGG